MIVGGGFPVGFRRNGVPFGSKSFGESLPRSSSVQLERVGNLFLGVYDSWFLSLSKHSWKFVSVSCQRLRVDVVRDFPFVLNLTEFSLVTKREKFFSSTICNSV